MTYTVKEFKRRVAVQLVQPYIDLKLRKFTLRNILTSNVDIKRVDGSDGLDGIETHTLLENTNKKKTLCFLCTIIDPTLRSRWTSYGCTECQKGFHVNFLRSFTEGKTLK